MNIWNGIGNVTADINERMTADGLSISKFTLAINDGYGDKKTTDYINVVAFGKLSENCAKYLHKGSKCAVTGKVQTGSYVNKDGVKVYTTDVMASRIEFLESASKSEPKADLPAGFEEVDLEDTPF